ncbi:hypothetical protein [Nostoc sp.]|uniref:hypothetical protein n=1 Tax=Nostoc sp. TaxID=1180 RepID=UPI002FFBF4B8
MQILQSPLGNNIHPLGVISSLSHPHRMVLRKESNSLHSRNNFISPIQTKPPLITSSKFFLSGEHEPSIQPLIGWDTQDINSEFPLLEFDSFDSIAQPENSNINSSDSGKDSVPEIMPSRADKNQINDISQELNTRGKSKSTKANKSQQPPEKKSKPKSKTKKTVKSSAAKNVEQFVDESKISISSNEDSLLASNEPLSVEINSDIPTLQRDIYSEKTTNDNEHISSITASTLPIIEDESSLLSNIANDNSQINSEIKSSFSSADSSVQESILSSPEKIELDKNTSDLAIDLPIKLPLHNNVEEIFTPSSNFTNNEQKVIPEASESFNILDIPVSPTPPQQGIETDKFTSIVDNQGTASKTNLIQAKEVSPSLNSPSQEELLNTNSNFEAITAIEPDLILETTANDFVTDNAIVDNSLTLSSALPSPNVDEAPTLLHPLANDENAVVAHSYAPLPHVTAPNSESSVAKSPIVIQQEIDSSITSQFPASAPVQLTPTSTDIEDTPSLFRNSDSNEQLVTSESQSAMIINVSDVSDVSANVTSLQHDSNVENTTSESIESHPILALPEIGEAPLITPISPEIGETAIAPLTARSPEISETAIAPLTTRSPEISETAIAPLITPISPEIGETAIAPLTTRSPEIGETAIAPLITTTSPEIGEARLITPISPEIVETPLITPISPEIVETPLITPISPEIGEAPLITAISPEIAETAIAPKITATPPEISEAPKITATPPEIGEAPLITAISPEIAETAIAPLTATSPEIAETAITPTITAISPEIAETAIAPLITTTSPEIAEAPLITTTSPEISETAIAPLTATSPEIAETAITPTITATSPEIAETAIAPLTATSPEIAETAIAPLTPISPEIAETAIAPTITATSPEIAETAIAPLITTTSPEIAEAPLITTTSPEISETAIAPKITTTSPEIGETAIAPTITATSPEIAETAIAPLTATSPEIAETAIAPLTATSPEIDETAIAPLTTTSLEIAETAIAPLTATSPEIAETAIAPLTAISPEIPETASIFRKIIDNEQTVESEFPSAVTNPEISTFLDTSDNPDIPEEATSPQNEVSTPPEVEQNTTIKNLPAPKGYATSGHVTDFHVENRQQIAPSDTVPAMLTPGEFVINTTNAQKNLPLLHHINTGGTPHDIILPSLQTPNPTEPEEKTSLETPTKVDSFADTSLQLKSAQTPSPQISNSLIPSSLGLDIGKQKLSILNFPQLNPLQNETIDVGEPSPQYSSPPLIFRKANSTTQTPSQWSNTPSQWSSVEDLLNGNNEEFTSFNFSDMESNSKNSEFSQVSESPQIFAKHLPRGFADGGEVTPPDISREIEPVTETIESASSTSEADDKNDPANLEALAREIYNRLRQRIEIERERHGGSSGRLPW